MQLEKSNETILETLLKSGEDPERQCCSGYCGSCRVKLKSGSVEYKNEPMAFLNQGEILPCICVPATPIEIAAI